MEKINNKSTRMYTVCMHGNILKSFDKRVCCHKRPIDHYIQELQVMDLISSPSLSFSHSFFCISTSLSLCLSLCFCVAVFLLTISLLISVVLFLIPYFSFCSLCLFPSPFVSLSVFVCACTRPSEAMGDWSG